MIADLKEIKVPQNVIDEYLTRCDEYFRKIYDNLTKQGFIAERDAIFGNFFR
jgi:hypothetical protein